MNNQYELTHFKGDMGHGVASDVWPESQVDGSWPAMLRVEQLFPCTLAEVPNSLLSYPILKMGVDAAKG